MEVAYTKKVRLKNGRFVTVKRMTSDPVTVSKADTHQKWECSDGRILLICDMDTRHLLNTVAMLERRAKDMKKAIKMQAAFGRIADNLFPALANMRAELKKRLKPAKTAPAQVKTRHIELED